MLTRRETVTLTCVSVIAIFLLTWTSGYMPTVWSSAAPEEGRWMTSLAVTPSPPVEMYIHDTVRYQLHTKDARSEYAHLLPPGGHTVKDKYGQVYTVAMFHQLRCLDVLRETYVSRNITAFTRHCFNYLRQSILCLSDTRLESIKSSIGQVTLESDYVCKDWTAVYAAAESMGR